MKTKKSLKTINKKLRRGRNKAKKTKKNVPPKKGGENF